MGQRLVLEINDKTGINIANIYYHWSGYTISALQEIQYLLGNLDEADQNLLGFDLRLKLLRIIEDYGGGMDPVERKRFASKHPEIILKPEDQVSRNNGLISFSQEGMEQSRQWQEADAVLDFSNNSIDTEGLYFLDEPEMFADTVDDASIIKIMKNHDDAKFYEAVKKHPNLTKIAEKYTGAIDIKDLDQTIKELTKITDNDELIGLVDTDLNDPEMIASLIE